MHSSQLFASGRQAHVAGHSSAPSQITIATPGAARRALRVRVPVPQTGPVAKRVRVREINDDEGSRLVRIVRRGSGSVVTWRRAQMVLLSAQGMDVAGIAKVAFTSEDRSAM
jgi:hypothetical protein